MLNTPGEFPPTHRLRNALGQAGFFNAIIAKFRRMGYLPQFTCFYVVCSAFYHVLLRPSLLSMHVGQDIFHSVKGLCQVDTFGIQGLSNNGPDHPSCNRVGEPTYII